MLFGGDKLYMLPSVTPLQCMGFLVAGQGDVIGIDSCTKNEADELEEQLLKLGGRVDCWFLTHGHFDHIEGVIEMLKRGRVEIKSVCYRFPPLDYIERVERQENRVQRVADLETELAKHNIKVIRPVKGQPVKVGHFTVLPLSDGAPVGETLNPSSVVFRVETRGEPILFLGDMDWRAEDKILREFPDELKCNVVQMAHHGQQGVTEKFYAHVQPKVCLWPTPEWLWNNDIGGGYGTGPYKTLETRSWMKKLNTVNYHFEKEITVLE